MQNSNLARHVRSVLESLPDALPRHALLNLTNEFVAECSISHEPHAQLSQLEEDLQKVLHDVDLSALFQTEVFLDVLYLLGPILPPTSVISWFDIILRPALREPKLSTPTLNHAKELIISVLQNTENTFLDKVDGFRRRLLDLYLLDAYNEGSGDDALEWAELDEEQRERRIHWKRNLEDILLKSISKRPGDLLTEIYVHFEDPTSRLQLFMLLHLYTSEPSFQSSSKVFAEHPMMTSILHSLMLDNSSTVCTAGLTLLVKLLPIFAVHAREVLKLMLPRLLAVLARLMCWKERPPSGLPADGPPNEEVERELENEVNRVIPILPALNWTRLELSFIATPSPSPSPRRYFTTLYYLYPSNVITFLKNPTMYLVNNSCPSPYTLEWHEVFAEDEIRRGSERLIREHVCHPLLIWRDAATELSESEFWTRYSVARITSEICMLDVRNSALGIVGSQRPGTTAPHQPLDDSNSENTDQLQLPARLIHPIDLSTERTSISVHDMISTSLALKSNIDVQIVKPVSQWPHSLFPQFTPPSETVPPLLSTDNVGAPPQIVQVISALQREALLLRNELNFELWLSRENVQHIGRLYEDRILSKSAEAERQRLFNKLRKYRTQVITLEAELREHKQQTSSAKNKYTDWNTELQKKLKELKDEKKAWVSEAATLRSAKNEAKALSEAQGKLLADALKEVFELQTQRKETQHKIDRLRDYEQQIEQHIKMQCLWDADFVKFNDRAEEISLMQSRYRQLEMRLESYEKTQAEMEDNARVQRRKIQALEARLLQAQRNPKPQAGQEIAAFVAERTTLMETNGKLKDENMLLKDELEEMRAMIEVLKGRRGLISEPRSSPLSI